ncbi:MAG: Ycf48-like protein [Ignavibacteria bacterium]|nr:Ycf48-like protein [Ignavibacteria bacterium]
MHISEAQWIAQNSGTNQNLYDIEFLNEKTGWAVGDAGVVIKTTNGGINWNYVPNPTPTLSPNLWSVEPIDSNIVYVTSSGDFIMKTTDGGLNWRVLHSCPECNSSTKGIYFLNKDTGWILGAYKVFRTYDGGKTLDSFYVPWFTNFDIYFKDINTGVFCGTGRVFKSTDRGESWINTNVPTSGSFPMFRKLGISNNNIWIGGGNPNIYKSSNFGENWFVSDSTIGAFGISFINENTGFIGGGLNILYKTTNGGNNFYRQRTDSSSLAFISSIDFVNDTVGWYCCAVGRIYKTTTGGEFLTDINFNPIELTTEDYKLYQNYPNPYNSNTIITYQIYKSANVEIEVYDNLGKKVKVLVKKKQSPGYYKEQFDGSNLSSGIYFYAIKIDDKYVESRRMIILK